MRPCAVLCICGRLLTLTERQWYCDHSILGLVSIEILPLHTPQAKSGACMATSAYSLKELLHSSVCPRGLFSRNPCRRALNETKRNAAMHFLEWRIH